MSGNLDRRDVLRMLTMAPLAGTLQLTAAEPENPLYFTKEEFALLDGLTEHIIPQDDHSPGAHEAGVAAFIDRSVAEAFLPEDKEVWRKGLAEIDRLSNEQFGRAFLKTQKEQQVALLKALCEKESNPATEGEKFFTMLKGTTAFAYYSSKIGIHKEMQYKGNVLLQQFAGYDAV